MISLRELLNSPCGWAASRAADAATPHSRELCDLPELYDRSQEDLRDAPINGDAIMCTAMGTMWESRDAEGVYQIVVDIVYDELKPWGTI